MACFLKSLSDLDLLLKRFEKEQYGPYNIGGN
jgi:hypothetical protein